MRAQGHMFANRGNASHLPVGPTEAGKKFLIDDVDTCAGGTSLTDLSHATGLCSACGQRDAPPLDCESEQENLGTTLRPHCRRKVGNFRRAIENNRAAHGVRTKDGATIDRTVLCCTMSAVLF
jgi:hypothetical protein